MARLRYVLTQIMIAFCVKFTYNYNMTTIKFDPDKHFCSRANHIVEKYYKQHLTTEVEVRTQPFKGAKQVYLKKGSFFPTRVLNAQEAEEEGKKTSCFLTEDTDRFIDKTFLSDKMNGQMKRVYVKFGPSI